MDATTLRIILLVLGVFLILGIYLFDKNKSASKEARSKSSRTQPMYIDDEDDFSSDNDEYGFSAKVINSDSSENETVTDENSGEAINTVTEAVTDESEISQSMHIDHNEVADEITEGFTAHGKTNYISTASMLMDEVPRLVVSVGVLSKNGEFTGEQIKAAMKKVDLDFGAMDLYHRYQEEDSDSAIFSLASMVEPGNFPEEVMADLRTPGISLFTQLPGVKNGLVIYSDMLFVAEKLALLLNAKLLDGDHNTLTDQTIAHTRDKILEHKQKVRLNSRRS